MSVTPLALFVAVLPILRRQLREGRNFDLIDAHYFYPDGVAAVLLFGLLIVVTLWVCFGLDYDTTRHVYFTVAMLHVLAEVPFLLRMV